MDPVGLGQLEVTAALQEVADHPQLGRAVATQQGESGGPDRTVEPFEQLLGRGRQRDHRAPAVRVVGAADEEPSPDQSLDGFGGGRGAQRHRDWARNIRAAGHGELIRGRVRRPVLLSEIHDAATKRAVMTAFPRDVPGGVPFLVRLGLVERADPAQFAAASDRVAVFEIQE